MDIYTLLRLLLTQCQLSPFYSLEEAWAIKQAGADLISKLETTQALGSLTSDLKGNFNV